MYKIQANCKTQKGKFEQLYIFFETYISRVRSINRFQINFRTTVKSKRLYVVMHTKALCICFSSGSILWHISHIHTTHFTAGARNSSHYHKHTLAPLLSAFKDVLLFSVCAHVMLPVTDMRMELESTLHMCAICRGG